MLGNGKEELRDDGGWQGLAQLFSITSCSREEEVGGWTGYDGLRICLLIAKNARESVHTGSGHSLRLRLRNSI